MKTVSYVLIPIAVIFAMFLFMHAPIYGDVKCLTGLPHSHFGYCLIGKSFDIPNVYGQEDQGFDNYPPIESKEFCDWYFAKTPNVPVNHIMKSEIEKNPLTMYFLSKFPDASYRITLTEDSDPPRKKSVYSYSSDNVTSSIEYFFVPCRYMPEPSSFLYQTKVVDADLNSTNFFEPFDVVTPEDVVITIQRIQNPHTGKITDYFEISVESSYDQNLRRVTNQETMSEVIHDSMLFLTHQKWLNKKDQIVYVHQESSENLVNRGYLVEQLTFFDLFRE